MLQAKSKNGELITPAMFPRDRLPLLKQESYYCPVCKGKVILKAGKHVIPHFAHVDTENCPVASGGEGPYHEQGKLALYHWLKNQGLQVEMECYLAEIKQRPDLLLQIGERIIAIEYQCARVPHEEIITRTTGYHQAGIHVLWILGERLMKRRGSHVLILDSFTRTFIHQFNGTYPFSLFYFCPITRYFIKFQDFVFTTKTRAVGKLSVMPGRQMNIVDLLEKEYFPTSSLRSIWLDEKRRFRTNGLRNVVGDERKWLHWLYEKGYHLEQLPSIIHLPIKSAFLMKRPGWIWQSWLVLDIIHPRPLGAVISIPPCRQRVRSACSPEEFFPSIQALPDPVHEYLQLLSELGVLERISETSFQKVADVQFHPHVDVALQEDERLIGKIFSKN